jgi:flagellar hook protein FlgE
MGSFSTSLSGLDAEEQALSVISNDLSNLNTTAFKTGTPVFSDLFYQMLGTDGAGDPVQVGVGATMSSVDSPFTQGDISSTGVPTDVAIAGNGLFVLNQNGTQVYTRAGNFSLNAQGNLVDSNGNNVMGYSAVNGVISTSQALSPIIISSGQTYPPNATANVQLDMNLDAADTSLAPATGTLTIPPPTLPTAGQTVNIGGTIYTFATALTPQSAADTVQIGTDIQSTLANLAAAINAAPAGSGTAYSSATVLANASVTATANATTLSLKAINTGLAGNSLASSTAWSAGSFGAADLTGGVNDQQATGTLLVPPPVPTAGETITLGATTYTFATALTPQSAADVVLIDPTSVQNTLANLAAAINLGAGSGTAYSSATSTANATVTATGTTATQITLQARNAGLAGNSDVTSTNWATGNFNGATNLGGGVDAVPATATFTVPAVTLPALDGTVAIGGTTYTFVQDQAALLAPNEVVRGADIQSTLTNLMNAINADPTNEGITFTSGTTANGTVSASSPTATSLTLTAITPGSAGDSGATYATATSWTGGAFAVTHLTGGSSSGVAASATFTPPASDPADGNTVTIGGTTYTFVANAGEQTTPEDVLIVAGDISTTLGNLAAAITANNSSSVTATANATTLSLQAIKTGAGGNSLGVSTTWSGALYAGGGLAGGVDAVAATGAFNVPLPLPTPGQTVNVGGTVYTFADTPVANDAANTVAIGPDVQTTMQNLMAAINLGAGSGTAYSTATEAQNAFVTASNPTSNSLTLTATAVGTAGNNSVSTVTDWSGGSFGAADLTGGVDAVAATGAYTVPISLPGVGQTVTVGGTTYTFVATAQDLAVPDEVVIGTDVGTTLSNLADAISATPAGAGITYATGTVANSSVTVTGSTASTLALQAVQNGSAGDSVATATNWTGGSFAAGDLTGGTDAGTFSDSMTVYDSLGNSHVLSFNFTKSSAGNWGYQITIPAADVGATGNPQVVASGTLQFGPNGNLILPSSDVQGISVSGLADGAKTMTLNWQLFDAGGTPNITQTAEASATSGKDQDGYGAGTLQSYTIESSGIIDGVLSNEQTVPLGQIALATFPNYDGLTNLGSNDYGASLSSGAPSVGIPGSGGRGTLDGSSLEASNVDIATAFTELIQAERGYEANAKAITTADDVMQASIALIQS